MGSILLDSKTLLPPSLPPSLPPTSGANIYFLSFTETKTFFGAPPFLFIFRDTLFLVGGWVGGLFSQKLSKPVAFLSFHHPHKLGFQNPFIKLVLLDLPACSLICVPVVSLSPSLNVGSLKIDDTLIIIISHLINIVLAKLMICFNFDLSLQIHNLFYVFDQ